MNSKQLLTTAASSNTIILQLCAGLFDATKFSIAKLDK